PPRLLTKQGDLLYWFTRPRRFRPRGACLLGEPTSAALSGPNGRCVGRPIIVWAMNDQLWTTLAGRRNSHTADLPGRDAAGTARSIKRNARGIAHSYGKAAVSASRC